MLIKLSVSYSKVTVRIGRNHSTIRKSMEVGQNPSVRAAHLLHHTLDEFVFFPLGKANDLMNTEYQDIHGRLRELFTLYAAAVALVEVELPDGTISCGTAYHIGDNVFITARHVVENKIRQVFTTRESRWPIGDPIPDTDEARNSADTRAFVHKGDGTVQPVRSYFPSSGMVEAGPFFHPNSQIDVAAIIVSGIDAPIIPLGDHLDDWLGNELVLEPVLVMGYPTIPMSKEPVLIASIGEVNAIIDKYTGGHPHFILSTMARGGFSGGPAFTSYGACLGVITESLLSNYQPIELGYQAVLSIEPIYHCLAHHKIMPKHIDEIWDGFWNEETIHFMQPISEASSEVTHRVHYHSTGKTFNILGSIRFYDGPTGCALTINGASTIFQAALDAAIYTLQTSSYSVEEIHTTMKRIKFSEGTPNSMVDSARKAVEDVFISAGCTKGI